MRMTRHILDVFVREGLAKNNAVAGLRHLATEQLRPLPPARGENRPIQNYFVMDNVNIHGNKNSMAEMVAELELAVLKEMALEGELDVWVDLWNRGWIVGDVVDGDEEWGEPPVYVPRDPEDAEDADEMFYQIGRMIAAWCWKPGIPSGAQVKFLPPYTPSLAPIEFCFWVLKSGINAIMSEKYFQFRTRIEGAERGKKKATTIKILKEALQEALTRKTRALVRCMRNTMERHITQKIIPKILSGTGVLGENDRVINTAQVDAARASSSRS